MSLPAHSVASSQPLALVVRRPRAFDVPRVPFCPSGKVGHCREQCLTHRRERIVDSRWYDGVNSPGYEPVPLETAQRHGEHALADPVDVMKEFSEAAAALAQETDHEH